MARVQVDYDPRAEALQTTAAPNIQAVQTRFDPRSSQAFQLAEALGKAEPVIKQFNEDYERKKLQEQILKREAYAERFRQDRDGGDITAVQVGQKYPEMVPAVRGQVVTVIGEKDGKQFAQPVLDGILKDENLRYNTEARTAHLKAKRAEFIANLKGDDFYKAGAIRAFDAEMGQYENSFQRETATRDIALLTEKFDSEVEKTFAQPDPKKALEALDATWKANNGLSNQTRNERVVTTATKLAFATDRPEILDQIPERFLNAETKAVIAKTKVQVQELRMTNFRNAQAIKSAQREEGVRNAKVDMINRVARGEQVDPAQYRNDPEAFNFAMSMKDAGRLPDAQSAATAQAIRTQILNTSTVSGLDQGQVVNQILANPALNPKEKQALINDVPKLIEGQIALNDPMVKSAMDARIDARLKSLESSTNASVQARINGRNLRSEVVRSFDMGVRQSFQSYFEENGRWPTGRAKQDIVDIQTDRAEKLLESLTSLQALSRGAAPGTAPGAAPASPAARPAAAPAARPQPTQNDIDFVKKNPQFRQQFINQFGREP